MKTIQYVVAPCSLGWTLVAATDHGICMIELGDSPETLHDHVRAKFKNVHIKQSAAGLEDALEKINAMIDTPRHIPDLTLDIQGTTFQLRVWEAVRAIPPGSTASYTQIAAKIGSPKAVRAVAGACAANSLAIVIPCHRVLRSDGAMGGFGWGVERKKELLDRESLTVPGNRLSSS